MQLAMNIRRDAGLVEATPALTEMTSESACTLANKRPGAIGAAHFVVRPLCPKGWHTLLGRILPDFPEVSEVRFAAVRINAERQAAVMGIFLSVYTPGFRQRQLRLELERLLPVNVPFEVMFARTTPQREGGLALAMQKGGLLYQRSARLAA